MYMYNYVEGVEPLGITIYTTQGSIGAQGMRGDKGPVGAPVMNSSFKRNSSLQEKLKESLYALYCSLSPPLRVRRETKAIQGGLGVLGPRVHQE